MAHRTVILMSKNESAVGHWQVSFLVSCGRGTNRSWVESVTFRHFNFSRSVGLDHWCGHLRQLLVTLCHSPSESSSVVGT